MNQYQHSTTTAPIYCPCGRQNLNPNEPLCIVCRKAQRPVMSIRRTSSRTAMPACPCSRNAKCPRCGSYCYGDCHH